MPQFWRPILPSSTTQIPAPVWPPRACGPVEALRGVRPRAELTQTEGDPKDQNLSAPGLSVPADGLGWVVHFLECSLPWSPGRRGALSPLWLWPFVSISCGVGIGKGWRLFPAWECGWVLLATPLGPQLLCTPGSLLRNRAKHRQSVSQVEAGRVNLQSSPWSECVGLGTSVFHLDSQGSQGGSRVSGMLVGETHWSGPCWSRFGGHSMSCQARQCRMACCSTPSGSQGGHGEQQGHVGWAGPAWHGPGGRC